MTDDEIWIQAYIAGCARYGTEYGADNLAAKWADEVCVQIRKHSPSAMSEVPDPKLKDWLEVVSHLKAEISEWKQKAEGYAKASEVNLARAHDAEDRYLDRTSKAEAQVAELTKLHEARSKELEDALNEATTWKLRADIAEAKLVSKQPIEKPTSSNGFTPKSAKDVEWKLGDTVYIYLDELGRVSDIPTDRVIPATVLGIPPEHYRYLWLMCLGWTAEDEAPIEHLTFLNPNPEWSWLPNNDSFERYISIGPFSLPSIAVPNPPPVEVEKEPKSSSFGTAIGLAAAALVGAGLSAIGNASRTESVRVQDAIETIDSETTEGTEATV